MRQVKYLIKEAKENTNTRDVEAISNELCFRLLTRAQSYLMAYLYNKNIESKIFRGTDTIEIQNSVDTYDLPADIYAVNSISTVQYVTGAGANISYTPVDLIADKDRGLRSGYILAKDKMIFSPVPTMAGNFLVTYTKKLPALATSYGTIQSVTPTTIVLAPGYTSLTDIDDLFTVVNSSGEIIVNDLPVSQVGDTLTVPSTAGVSSGMFVVPGKYASTHCFLPDEMESVMIYWLERLIQMRLSSTDINISSAISNEQLEEVATMFADNVGDSFIPPIREYGEWV